MANPIAMGNLIVWITCVTISGCGLAAEPEFVLQWGSAGEGPGQFHSPICIAVSPDDHIFVADLNNSRMQQFKTSGEYVAEFELPRDVPDRKSSLVGGMAFTSDGHLCVSYMNQHKLVILSQTGTVVRQWGTKGTADGQFVQPGGIIVRANGNVVVADQCNHRLQEFSHTGEHIRTIGQYGAEVGQFGGPEPMGSRFGGPHFLAQDSQGNMFTTEGAAGRIQQFAADGTARLSWGSKIQEPGAFGQYNFGNLKNTFGPIGVFVDRDDRVWVSSLNNRVQCFTGEGKFLHRIDGVAPDDDFLHPHGMAQDSQGFLYIADSGGQRITKFDIRSQ